MRQCGSCTLCCKLLPIQELNKKAGVRCEHQRHTGCRIYKDRPLSCMLWNCAWLIENDHVAGLPRPDRAGYVIDIIADYVLVGPDDDQQQIPVVQIWADPKRPDAWRTPEVRTYIERRAKEGTAAIIRYSNVDAITVFAPNFFAGQEEWIERHSTPNFKLKPWEAWQNA